MGLEELQAMQKKLVKAAQDLANHADDPKTLLEKAAEISKGGKQLEESALRLQAQFDPAAGGKEERVILTADQRQRLAEETGVALEALVVRDPTGEFARAMPSTQKATIEKLAAREAAMLAVKKARGDAIEKLVKHLKSLEVEGLAPVIEAIEADPSLKKLKEQQEEFAKEQKEKSEGTGA